MEGQGGESENVTIIQQEEPLEDQDDQVIDNGIMYMDKDKIVYYNQNLDREDNDASGQQPDTSNRMMRPRMLRSSVLSLNFADGS